MLQNSICDSERSEIPKDLFGKLREDPCAAGGKRPAAQGRPRRLACPGARVYLSLGRKEEKTRNPYLCKIGDCYRREEELLTRQLGASRVTMTWHDGGHATEVPRRMLLGLETLLKTPAL